jgi:hypothetical protein
MQVRAGLSVGFERSREELVAVDAYVIMTPK